MGPDHTRRFALNKPDTPIAIGYRSRFDECDALRLAFDRLGRTGLVSRHSALRLLGPAGSSTKCNLTTRTPSKSETRTSVTPAAPPARVRCSIVPQPLRPAGNAPLRVPFHRDAHERNRIALAWSRRRGLPRHPSPRHSSPRRGLAIPSRWADKTRPARRAGRGASMRCHH
jgi:hypothetical protein